MDTVGNELAKSEIAVIKVAVPNMACQVIDWAIQAHVGGGTGNDFGLAAGLRHGTPASAGGRTGRGPSQSDCPGRTTQLLELSRMRAANAVWAGLPSITDAWRAFQSGNTSQFGQSEREVAVCGARMPA
jgi:alkylation response protein AidB-like acyl-CoA dehydrogenase